jgi:hypothetical protein
MMKELVHFFGDSVLLSRTHSQAGSMNIFTGVTADWNVARSLYTFKSCIDKVRPEVWRTFSKFSKILYI